MKVSSESIKDKIEAAFFSWVKYCFVPKEKLNEAVKACEELRRQYPTKEIYVIGVENISEPELAKLLTPEQLATRKAFKTKAAQDRYTASILMPNAPRKMTLKERAVESYMAEGMDYRTALKTAEEEEAANRGKGNIRGQIEGAKSAMGEELAPPVTPMPQPPVQAPAPKYVPGTIVKVRGKVMKITNAQGDLEEVK